MVEKRSQIVFLPPIDRSKPLIIPQHVIEKVQAQVDAQRAVINGSPVYSPRLGDEQAAINNIPVPEIRAKVIMDLSAVTRSSGDLKY